MPRKAPDWLYDELERLDMTFEEYAEEMEFESAQEMVAWAFKIQDEVESEAVEEGQTTL